MSSFARMRAIQKQSTSGKKAKPKPPEYMGLLDVLIGVAAAGVKLPWQVSCSGRQVNSSSTLASPGGKWRQSTKNLKDPDDNRAMSWGKEDSAWVSFNYHQTVNALTLRQAFDPNTNVSTRDWSELMRDRGIINSITFQTLDGQQITRQQAFDLNDQVNSLPDPDNDLTQEPENDDSLDAPVQ